MDSHALKSNLLEFIINGKFYCPAFSHYGNKPINVICSICNKQNLISCIGSNKENYKSDSYDFCLECVDKITNSYNLNIHANQDLKSNQISKCSKISEPMYFSNSNKIVASNDFTNSNGSWEEQFVSNLSPVVSGYEKNNFSYEGFSNNFDMNNLTNSNNYNNQNNQNETNYLEHFFQPLNPNGFKRR